MRRSTSVIGAALLALTTGCGESPVDPEELSAQTAPLGTAATERGSRSRDGVLEHAEALGLSDAQVAAIERILTDLRAANAPLLERLRPQDGERPARDEARELLGQIRDRARAAQEEVLAQLTDEQRRQLQELRAERRGRDRGGRGGRGFGPGAGGAGMLHRFGERLELTEAQRAELRTIAEELRTQNQPLLEQLRSGERPGPDDPRLAQIRENVRAATERMLAVLTDAQRAELEELRERRPDRGDGRGRGRGPGGRSR